MPSPNAKRPRSTGAALAFLHFPNLFLPKSDFGNILNYGSLTSLVVEGAGLHLSYRLGQKSVHALLEQIVLNTIRTTISNDN